MSALDVFAGMIAACATVQVLLGVDGEADPAAAALAQLIADDGGAFDWIDSGSPGQSLAFDGSSVTREPPLAIVLDGGTEEELLDAPATSRSYGSVALRLYALQPSDAVLTAASTTAARWARAQQEAIADELRAQIAGPAAFAALTINLPRPICEAGRGRAFAGAWMLGIDCNWD